jgi:3-dehydroquinate dehydratase-2
MKFLVINGVNLNLTGLREKEIYGTRTLEEINAGIAAYCFENGDEVAFFQSNCEGVLVDKLHEAFLLGGVDGIVLNAGAYTHYSYALRDAIAAINIPVVEAHLSDVNNREAFRRVSVLADVCLCVVSGLGERSYYVAIDKLRERGAKKV